MIKMDKQDWINILFMLNILWIYIMIFTKAFGTIN